VVSNREAPIQTWKYYKDSKTNGIIVNAPLHPDLSVPLETKSVGGEIKRLGQRYVDRMEKHFDILAINLTSDAKTLRGLERRLVHLTGL